MAIPSKIGRYEIKSELGRGGMATVYRAYDPSFDREVAIKVLPREMMHDPQFRSRFERELKIVAALEHPSIVPVYDVGEEDGQPYFVMRYMNGGSLAGEIEKGKFALEDAARIVEKIAQGLSYAHKKGIVHRDLKPDNILFDDMGVPFISDFGIAKLSESSGSLTGSGVIGTPAYMSPEQARGLDVDGRSDVYGLGVIVYQMLSGQQPYNADTPMGVVVKHITEPVPEILKTLPSLPFGVDQIIKTSMAKDRDKRYAKATDLAKALNLVAFGEEGNVTSGGGTGLHTRVSTSSTMSSSRGKTGIAVGGIVLLVVLAGFFVLRNQLFPAPQPTATSTDVASPATSTETKEPTVTAEEPTLVSTGTPITIIVTATESVASPLPFAPSCAAGVLLPLPDIKESNKTCVKKIPYTSLSIPEGATFESLDSDMTCIFETTVNGRTLISCTGPQLFSYDLKVCKPPVLSDSDLASCASDSTFNSEDQCCVAAPPDEAACVTYAVDIRACQ